MGQWRLSSDAVNDLDLIARWGAQTFGSRQSERYEQRLVQMLDRLASNPRMAAERQALRTAIRLMPCDAHHILYAIDGEDIVILRVLHHLQDWFELL